MATDTSHLLTEPRACTQPLEHLVCCYDDVGEIALCGLDVTDRTVVRREHEGGSQSWHVWVDETEFVAYLNGPTGMHAAWRLEPPAPLRAGAAATPVVSIYDPEPQRDVELLLQRMPDEPAALLRDAIFPF